MDGFWQTDNASSLQMQTGIRPYSLTRQLALGLTSSAHHVYSRTLSFAQFLTWSQMFLLFGVGMIAYVVAQVFYRLYLSPLAAFPGPFLAKVTHWYEFYHNWVRTGMYYQTIREMHDKYGPVVRVTPDEIHVLEPSMYHKIFVSAAVRKTDSYLRFSNGTGFEDMTAISVPHDFHRRFRAPLDKLFARASILRIEPRIVARAERLCSRLRSYQDTGEVVNLTNALSSLITDVISCTIFEEPSDYLGSEDFNAKWYETLKFGTRSVPLFKHMPFMFAVVGRPFLRAFVSRVTHWTVWDSRARRQVLLTRKRPSDEAKTRDDTTVLDHLVHSDLVEKEFGKSGFARLAQLIQQAGAHNVSHTLGTIVTSLLLDPKKLELLREELEVIWTKNDDDEEEETENTGKTEPSWHDLEKAPYLSAVVSEGLRMSIGGMNRTPRVSPDLDIECCGWIIPKGTPVSMSSHWMHNDPVVFPDPESFEPSRWLIDDAEKLKVMQAYFVPFAKGTRNCLGQNLVYMTMFHTLAQLFRPGAPELKLQDTTMRDIIAIHGLLFPMPPFDSKGVQVTVT